MRVLFVHLHVGVPEVEALECTRVGDLDTQGVELRYEVVACQRRLPA